MGISEPPAGFRGRAPGGASNSLLKLKMFELADIQRRGKSAKFYIFWTRSSAQIEVNSAVFAIFCILC